MHSPVTLILTFSLREKELRFIPELCCKLPLPEGEGRVRVQQNSRGKHIAAHN
jgi:hypothetical protein